MTLQNLMKLIYENDLAELGELKTKGVDFSIVNPDNQNNLLIAYSGYGYNHLYSQNEMCKFLISSGIDIDHQKNGRGEKGSALHNAVGNGHLDIVKTLTEHNANLEIRDINGNTPLLQMVFAYAGEKEKLEIIEYLISRGASLETVNDHGISLRESIISLGESIDEGLNQKEWDLRFLLEITDRN